MAHLAPVDDEHPVAGDREEVRRRLLAVQDGLEPPVHRKVRDRGAAPGRDAQQPSGLGVADRHPAVGVDREHALADAVQHRLAFLDQVGQLVGFEAERLAFQPPPDRRGGHRRRAARCRPRTARRWPAYGAPGGRSPRRRSPTLTSPTRAPVWSRSGTLPRADRPSVPRSMTHDLVAGQRRGRVGADHLADLRAVGVGQADAVPVGDDDEERPGGAPDPLGALLDDAVRVAVRHRVADDRVGGDRAREGQRPPGELVAELVPLQPRPPGRTRSRRRAPRRRSAGSAPGGRSGCAGAGP